MQLYLAGKALTIQAEFCTYNIFFLARALEIRAGGD